MGGGGKNEGSYNENIHMCLKNSKSLAACYTDNMLIVNEYLIVY